MAQKGKKTAGAVQVKAQSKDVRKPAFGKTNMTLFVVALVVIALGFVTLAFGSDTLAPILLVLGYCVIIPVSILWKDKDKEKADD